MINQLIVNADDFGMTQANTIGILVAHKEGIVTSTTCMMNMPYAKFALKQAQHYPQLGVGIHLVLTVGRPLIDGAHSYTDEMGNFIRPKDYPDGKPHGDVNELYREWKAQIEKFIEIAGHKPTHIDSHHHVHLLPWHQEVAKALAKEYDLPIRQRHQIIDTYPYIPVFDKMYDEDVNYQYVTEVLQSHSGALELMCHPAYLDQRLYDMSSYNLPRMKELEFLTSSQIKSFIQENHIELINFSNLHDNFQ
ncbi:chitin disaccharide deacetylase [Allocoprobacillus halotolerans]|uniref:Chitin disaccharide deacetylase n=1 Tax=Allocoprobacillus halotolerans TaxID=2944914 RepID=A0ABY5I3W4_9FIRM|nr:chitin disaccharide deacetylase [Allocoprobacillus halotolerans]UTY40031.1 chitin disaccharide deacetylase [Allocoprobacillus halotolerans]